MTTQKEKEQNAKSILSKDSIKTILKHVSTTSRYADLQSIRKISKQEVLSQDSVPEGNDSIQLSNHQIIENQDTQKRKEFYNAYTSKQLSNDKKSWSLAVSYSGGKNKSTLTNQESLVIFHPNPPKK